MTTTPASDSPPHHAAPLAVIKREGHTVPYDARKIAAALAACAKGARTEGLDRAFDKHRLDAIIAPTGGPAWLIDPVGGDHYGASFSTPAAVAGYPHLTVPMGAVQGLPIGVSFIGGKWTDAEVLAAGYAYEQASLKRVAPTYRVGVAP